MFPPSNFPEIKIVNIELTDHEKGKNHAGEWQESTKRVTMKSGPKTAKSSFYII